MIGVIGATGACQYYLRPASLMKAKVWPCHRYFYSRDRKKSASFAFVNIIFLALCHRFNYMV